MVTNASRLVVHNGLIGATIGASGVYLRHRRQRSSTKKQLYSRISVLTLAPKGPPCGFSQIAPEVLGISLWNLPYLSGQQFHTLCQKIRTQVITGQPWVTSEWRHVSPILINKMGLRESPPLVQFSSNDQLTYMKWRRISRATKLLSRIFKMFKILKKFKKKSNFFLFETVSPQIKIFKQP